MATITVTGNLAADPELRFLPNGTPVVEFVVLENLRRKNDAGEWVDGDKNSFPVKAWRSMAENIVESVSATSGNLRVTVTGRIRTNRWTDRDSGQARSAQYIEADDVSISLRYHTAHAEKASRGATDSEPAGDPWAAN